MKNIPVLKKISFILFLSFIVASCSSDNGGGNDSKYFENVPKGEIVPVGERFVTLTGYEEGANLSSNEETIAVTFDSNSQKWWEFIYGEYKEWCDGEYDSEQLEETGYYYAFFPNGKLYMKYGTTGAPQYKADWQWANSSKSKVKITFEEEFDGEKFSLDYEFTELNSSAVTYAALISEDGCKFVEWVQFGNPID